MKHLTVLALILFASLFVSPSGGINATFGAVAHILVIHCCIGNMLCRTGIVVANCKQDRKVPSAGYINRRVISAVRVRATDYTRHQNGGYATLYRCGLGF